MLHFLVLVALIPLTELVYLILQKLFTAISMHAVAIHTLFSWPKRKKIIGSSFFLDPTGYKCTFDSNGRRLECQTRNYVFNFSCMFLNPNNFFHAI